MSGYQLKFTDKILDNVHGFIEFTEVEKEIIQLPVFKRLQGIKQLGLTNWIFPGAEHTRFIHSLGVMHIADLMAVQLSYTDEERQLVRLAGLLHDIGHYPLSHVGERAYKEAPGSQAEERVYKEVPDNAGDVLAEQRRHVLEALDGLKKEKILYMQETKNPCHHERITERVLKSDRDIHRIIETRCGGSRLINVGNICDIITGNVERNPAISGLVQLIHSELDADRIDYIMRDATFSGTSYGNFELGLFLRNLSRITYEGAEIIGVHPKGIAIADQFLMNRYYSYTQVFFNRHVSILEFMAQALSKAFIRHPESEYPSRPGIFDAVDRHNDDTEFLYFTDRAFWDSLHHVDLPDGSHEAVFRELLLRYQELDLTENREISVNFSDVNQLMGQLMEHPIYRNMMEGRPDRIPVVYIEKFTGQVPEQVYDEMLERAFQGREFTRKERERLQIRRLQEGITILEDGKKPVLLCDSPASLMSQLYPLQVCILREYQFENGGGGER